MGAFTGALRRYRKAFVGRRRMNGPADGSMVTIRTAARLTGVSADTIKRRLAAGAYPGAVRVGGAVNAPWLIPATALPQSAVASTRAVTSAQNARTSAPTSGAADSGLELGQMKIDLAVAVERARIYAAINERLLDIIDRGLVHNDDDQEGQR